MRTIAWTVLWLFSLCTLEIRAVYSDGLEIKFHNAWKRKRPALAASKPEAAQRAERKEQPK